VRDLASAAGEPPEAEALIGYARTAWKLDRRPQADEALSELARMHVQEGWILTWMGNIYVHEGRMPEAWAVLTKAVLCNDPWAELAVGKTLYFGCADINPPANPDAGLAWIRRAAIHGTGEAQVFIRRALFRMALVSCTRRDYPHAQLNVERTRDDQGGPAGLHGQRLLVRFPCER
jgi:hypothetical protein